MLNLVNNMNYLILCIQILPYIYLQIYLYCIVRLLKKLLS